MYVIGNNRGIVRPTVTVAISLISLDRFDLTKTKLPDARYASAVHHEYTVGIGHTCPRSTNRAIRRPQWTQTGTFTAAFNRAGTLVTEFPFS